jgi:hypothetical protein
MYPPGFAVYITVGRFHPTISGGSAMTNGTISVLAGVATYMITRLSYWALKFNPQRDLQFLPGLLVDITIWALVFFLVRWVLLKTTAPQPGPQ